MTSTTKTLVRLLAGASFAILTSAACGAAFAAEAAQGPNTGTEGSSADQVIITAAQGQAAANAPTKASITETQPESIITRAIIEQLTPETGSWISSAALSPGVSGISGNGGGVGETAKLTMRGFQDGQFNVTYDGIAFGDTNGPTHHEASYWPASTIGAVVVDRGPGAAGDLGQANFGGAIHMFSGDPTHQMGASQKFTVGSFDTVAAVTTLNTGDISQLFGGRLMINLDERNSAGELSYSGGEAQNQLAKFVLPIGDKWTVTLFGSHNYTRFYQADAGSGETWGQVLAYGKNFALTDNPNDEHFYKYNIQTKQTDFEYADAKGEIISGLSVEDQLYSYFYTNKTWATSSITDPVQGSPVNSAFFPGQTPNGSSAISSTKDVLTASNAGDIQGYQKLNQYRVYGDIVRANKDWSFGTLKVGGVYEWSGTDRANGLYDFTQGDLLGGPEGIGDVPDYKFQKSKYTALPATTNFKTLENSAYQTYQLFADFYWHPIDNLTITPGIKYVHSDIQVNAADEKVSVAGSPTAAGNEPLVASNTYSSPLYFLTANYRVLPELAVYFQYATSFQLPGLPTLYYQAASTQSLQPQRTSTYQGGVVYNRGNLTADADLYRIDATDLQVNCTVDQEAATCNAGSARYTGVEGELAYHLDMGLTLFANGSLMSAEQLANAANPGAGIAANPSQTLANAPKSTAGIGAIYRMNGVAASVSYKQSGAYVAGYNGNKALNLPGYDSLDGSVGYDFGHYSIKLQAFNLLDRRAITNYTGGTALYSVKDLGLYTFQAGREIQVTLGAKF